MKPRLRKFALAVHITLSVGWLGAVVAYLALAVVGLVSGDADSVRAMYLSMEVLGWFVIVPLSLAALLVGLVEALGTPWGLFRYWWVLAKFLLTTAAALVLLQHMAAVTGMANIARESAMSAADYRGLRVQLVVHAAGGLLVLLTATALSVYKPWGMTPYGLRTVQGRSDARVERVAREPLVVSDRTRRTPRWAFIVGIHAVGLALLAVVLHLAGGGGWSH